MHLLPRKPHEKLLYEPWGKSWLFDRSHISRGLDWCKTDDGVMREDAGYG